jgi:hypothetical protein
MDHAPYKLSSWITPAELSGLYDFTNPVKNSNPIAQFQAYDRITETKGSFKI